MLRNVIFDFGGVICAFNRDDILSHFCAPEDHDEMYRAIYHDWDRLDEGRGDYDAYVAETLAMLPERLHDAARRFFQDWYRTMPPIEDVWALAARLKARGYGVYLLSNAPAYFDAHADEIPLLRMMDGLLISGSVAMFKPNAEIYDRALKMFGLNPSETLFVDDNPVNAEGARRVGMVGYAFDGDAAKLSAYIESLS